MEGRLAIGADRVYLHRVEIDRAEAPFELYRELAYTALSRLDLPLPAEGKILLKPNATVLYPAEKRIVTHPGLGESLKNAWWLGMVSRARGRRRVFRWKVPDTGTWQTGAGFH